MVDINVNMRNISIELDTVQELEDDRYKQKDIEITETLPRRKGMVSRLQQSVAGWIQRHNHSLRKLCFSFALIAYLVYLGYAINYSFEGSLTLIIFTSLTVIYLLYKLVRDKCGVGITEILFHPILRIWDKHWNKTKW